MTAILGLLRPSAEHYFQASRMTDEDLRRQIMEAATPEDAQRLGLCLAPTREGWEEEKIDILMLVTKAKFEQHEDLATILRSTDQKQIIMIDSDTWAGMNAIKGYAQGKNNMGKVLAKVREMVTVAS